MKNNSTLPHMPVTGLVISLALLLAACQKGPGSLPESSENVEMIADPGEIHNRMVGYYYAHRSVPEPGPETMFEEVMELSFRFLAGEGYDQVSLQEIRREVEEQYAPTPLKGSGKQGFCTDPSTFAEQLTATGLYSAGFIGEIQEILDLAEKKKGKQEIRDYVNHTFSGVPFNEPKDREAQQLFIDIFNGSYAYWGKREQGSLKGIQLKDSSWVIINDGIGGILGLVFGPVGSIVTATVFSVGTNEELKQ